MPLMVVIKIELWPLGNETKATELCRAHIINDCTGTTNIGNYIVRLMKRKNTAEIWRSGRIEGFPRLAESGLGEWDLLYRALRALVGDRNP